MNESKISWLLLTIGNLSRNKYWGESNYCAYHSVLATTTLVLDGDIVILVDPSEPIDLLEIKLKQAVGLTASDVDIVFTTHYHLDHRFDADCYPNAVCYMSAQSLKDWELEISKKNKGKQYSPHISGNVNVFHPVSERLTKNISLFSLPGHTPGCTGLLFRTEGKRILISGDTIMSEEYFEHEDGYWMNQNMELTKQSIKKSAANADIIIPGHGDAFKAHDHNPDEEKHAAITWRRLNLSWEAECTYLLQSKDRNIILNPSLSGGRMSQALYDRSGLTVSEIDTVISLDTARKHRESFEIFKNAQYYMPEKCLKQWNVCYGSEDAYFKTCYKKLEALPCGMELVEKEEKYFIIIKNPSGDRILP